MAATNEMPEGEVWIVSLLGSHRYGLLLKLILHSLKNVSTDDRGIFAFHLQAPPLYMKNTQGKPLVPSSGAFSI
jgi:hypothetical protein